MARLPVPSGTGRRDNGKGPFFSVIRTVYMKLRYCTVFVSYCDNTVNLMWYISLQIHIVSVCNWQLVNRNQRCTACIPNNSLFTWLNHVLQCCTFLWHNVNAECTKRITLFSGCDFRTSTVYDWKFVWCATYCNWLLYVTVNAGASIVILTFIQTLCIRCSFPIQSSRWFANFFLCE